MHALLQSIAYYLSQANDHYIKNVHLQDNRSRGDHQAGDHPTGDHRQTIDRRAPRDIPAGDHSIEEQPTRDQRKETIILLL